MKTSNLQEKISLAGTFLEQMSHCGIIDEKSSCFPSQIRLGVEASEICRKQKSKTIDEVCNQPPGSFATFIEAERKELRDIENERKNRIRATRSK